MKSSNNLVWIDLEMTGLNVETDVILEIATIITDSDLNEIAVGPEFVIHQPDYILDEMGPWCKEHHGLSGLTEAVKKSTITELEAETKNIRIHSTILQRKYRITCRKFDLARSDLFK